MRWPWAKREVEVVAGQFLTPPIYNGEMFAGGLGNLLEEVDSLDYWALRSRSAGLFLKNSYARGIVRRFVTNVINVGLSAESIPEESILGLEEDSLIDWSENLENRFALYADTPAIVDIKGMRTFGALQRQVYTEALVGGDCVVICRQDPLSKLPQLQIIPGDKIQTPMPSISNALIVDGVELDENGRHVAYHVDLGAARTGADRFQRIACRGEKTGRIQAWMVYGLDRREDAVRGEPLLSIAIQPLKEIEKFRGSAQRKAVINSMIAGFIERTDSKPGSMPLQSGAAKRVTSVTGQAEGSLPVSFTEMLPGVYMQRLQQGEKPTPYSTGGTDVNFGPFEAAILQGLAWALEMPPEIMQLSFEKNYSASQAAINEWKMLLGKERTRFGSENNDHVFQEWFLSELLLNKIDAPGYLEAFKDARQYDKRRAWTMIDWSGAIKPSVDLSKLVRGYADLNAQGWIDNERASRELTGTKFSKNIRRIKRENQMKMDAAQPIMDAEQKYGAEPVARALRTTGIDALSARILEMETSINEMVDDTARS